MHYRTRIPRILRFVIILVFVLIRDFAAATPREVLVVDALTSAPISRASIYAYPAKTDFAEYSAQYDERAKQYLLGVTSKEGLLRFSEFPTNAARLGVVADGYAFMLVTTGLEWPTVPSQRVQDGEGRTVVRLPKEISISGRLPIGYGSIQCHQLFRTADDHEGRIIGEISLNQDNGRFLFNHLASSSSCTLRCPEGVFVYELYKQQLIPGTHIDLGDLTKGFTLSGCVTLDKIPVTPCYIYCQSTSNGLLKQTSTDHEGRYTITHLPEGNYKLQFFGHLPSGTAEEEVVIDADKELNVDLSRKSASQPHDQHSSSQFSSGESIGPTSAPK